MMCTSATWGKDCIFIGMSKRTIISCKYQRIIDKNIIGLNKQYMYIEIHVPWDMFIFYGNPDVFSICNQ